MHYSAIHNALPIVAAAYGKKFGINIIIKGKEAMTDGNTIYLPALEMKAKTEKTVLWGYLAHEAAHIRYTDFNVFHGISSEPIRHALLNIVEDVRIERLLGKTYPGTHQSIHAVLAHLVHHGEIKYPKPDNPPALLQMMCLFTLRLRCLKQTVLYSLHQQVEASMQRIFPRSWLAQLDSWFDEVNDLTSTADALMWVDRLLDSIKRLPEYQSNSTQVRQSHSSDSDNGKMQHASSETESESEQGEYSDSSAQTNEPSKDKQSNALTPSAVGDAEQSSTSEPDEGNRSSYQGEDSPQSVNSEQGSDSENTASTVSHRLAQSYPRNVLGDRILESDSRDILPDIFTQAAKTLNRAARKAPSMQYVNIEPAQLARANYPKATKRFMTLALRESVALRAKLRGWLNGLQQQKAVPKQHGQRLLPKRLALSQAGETRLFKQEAKTIAPNADIHLLVDRSSSMTRGVLQGDTVRTYGETANLAALSLAFALEGIDGISLAVSFFGKSSLHPAVCSALRPKESVRANAGRFIQSPSGNTPMAEAIWFAVQDLLQQRGQRKIIIVITDGTPTHYPSTEEVIKRCQTTGIELVGIGIRENCVKALFEQAVVIEDVPSLKAVLFSVFTKSLAKSIQ